MMFLADAAIGIELIALVLSTSLLVWLYRNEGKCHKFAKAVGYFAFIVSFLGLLCTTFYTFSYWKDGYFAQPHAMQMNKGNVDGKPGMMDSGDMTICPMMADKGMMMKKMMGSCMTPMKGNVMNMEAMEKMQTCMMQEMMNSDSSQTDQMSPEEHESHH